MKSSSRIPREASVEVVRGVWPVMASAPQVHSWLEAVEARNLTRSSVHRCIRAMFMGEGGRNRTVRNELLEMVLNKDSAAPLVRACFELPSTLRGSAPSRHSVGISSPMLLLPTVRRSTPILLLGRWSHPAGPGIVLLMLRISPLLRLRVSPMLLLTLGRLLLMVLWALLLPWMPL